MGGITTELAYESWTKIFPKKRLLVWGWERKFFSYKKTQHVQDSQGSKVVVGCRLRFIVICRVHNTVTQITGLTGHRSRQTLLHPTPQFSEMRCVMFQIKMGSLPFVVLCSLLCDRSYIMTGFCSITIRREFFHPNGELWSHTRIFQIPISFLIVFASSVRKYFALVSRG